MANDAAKRKRIGRRWWVGIALMASLFGLLMVMAPISTVTYADGLRRLNLDDPRGQLDGARPTLLYHISAGHEIRGPTCRWEAPDVALSPVQTYEFRNRLGDAIPLLLSLARISGGLMDAGPGDAQATARSSTLRWTARTSSIDAASLRSTINANLNSSPGCSSTVRQFIDRGFHVCSVQRVFFLVDGQEPDAGDPVLGVEFDPLCFTPCSEETCGIVNNPDESPLSPPRMGNGSVFSWIKSTFDLIDYRKT